MVKKVGRPKVKIDFKIVKSLAKLHCTIKEIASVLDIPPSTLQDRIDFRLIYEKGLEEGKTKLRRIQLKLAEKSAAMAIFLGKNLLNQIDTPLIDQSKHYHKTFVYLDKKAVEENAGNTGKNRIISELPANKV